MRHLCRSMRPHLVSIDFEVVFQDGLQGAHVSHDDGVTSRCLSISRDTEYCFLATRGINKEGTWGDGDGGGVLIHCLP